MMSRWQLLTATWTWRWRHVTVTSLVKSTRAVRGLAAGSVGRLQELGGDDLWSLAGHWPPAGQPRTSSAVAFSLVRRSSTSSTQRLQSPAHRWATFDATQRLHSPAHRGGGDVWCQRWRLKWYVRRVVVEIMQCVWARTSVTGGCLAGRTFNTIYHTKPTAIIAEGRFETM